MAKDKQHGGLAAFIVGFPLFVLMGVGMVLRALFGIGRHIRKARYELADDVTCPNCHYPNPVAGRWECASCKAIYMGWVGSCPICGAGASWISCAKCGVSVVLPWTRL